MIIASVNTSAESHIIALDASISLVAVLLITSPTVITIALPSPEIAAEDTDAAETIISSTSPSASFHANEDIFISVSGSIGTN